MLTLAIKAKKKSSDLYNLLYTSSYANGIQYSGMYANLAGMYANFSSLFSMGKTDC